MHCNALDPAKHKAVKKSIHYSNKTKGKDTSFHIIVVFLKRPFLSFFFFLSVLASYCLV